MLLALRSLLEVAGPSLRDANQAAGKSVTISVVAGDAIWIGFVVAGAVDLSTSCADTAGGGTNAYSVDAALDGNSGWSMYSFHAVAKATETITVTITNPYTASTRTFYHVEAGCASVGLVDGAAVTNLDGAAVTTHPSANLTTTNPNDVIISFWVQADVGTTISENGTGFTRRITQGGMGTFDKVVTSIGTYNESVISTVATVYGSILVAFKAAPTSISGSGGTIQAIQTFAGTGTCAAPLSGSGGTTQAIQTIAGTGTCAGVAPLTGTGATVQAVQTITGSGTCYAAPLTGTGATVQSIQTIAGAGTCSESGRPLTVTLYANDGTTNLVTSQSVESRIVTLGRIGWAIDDQLTKIQPSDLTLQIADDDEAVWTWLQTQLQTINAGGDQQLFPPWLVVYQAGEDVFTGLIDLTSLRRDMSKRLIDLAAQDWSSMLANVPLTDISRPLPTGLSHRAGTNLGVGIAAMLFGLIWCGAEHQIYLPKGLDIRAGDFITSNLTGIQQFKVSMRTFTSNKCVLHVPGWNWISRGATSATFSRVATELDQLPYYTAQSGVRPGNAIALNSVEGITPGDTLQAVGGSEILVADVDNERKEIVSLRAITGIAAGTRLYLSAESLRYLVNQDAAELASLVAQPYSVDVARFVPGELVRPLFGWLTNENVAGADLLHPSDIEPTADGKVRIICENGAFKGTPEAGYAIDGAWGERYVDWTSQQVAAPALVMPDDSPDISEAAGTRNRVFYVWSWVREQYIQRTRENGDTVTYRSVWALIPQLVYTPRAINYPTYCIGYDYSRIRRIVVSNPNTGFATYSERRWNGSTWSAATTGNWPVTGWYPCQMVPMLGVAATTGPVSPQGWAMLALVSDGVSYALHLVWAEALVTLPMDNAIAAGAVLVTSPWGVYLVGPGGYGRITYSAGVLQFSWSSVGGVSAYLITNTFAAMDADSVYCCLRIDYPDPDNQAAVLTETRLLTLTTTPVAGVDPVQFSQRIMHGAPRVARAFRDPSTTDRIIGLLGSRLFRVSAEPPTVIERMHLDAMTGLEALEHIGQFLNAVIIPRESGRLELVSRNQDGAATHLQVDRVSVTQSRMSQHFFSVARVAAEDDALYADAYGAVVGGKALDISGVPTVSTEAGCYAVASNLMNFFGHPRRIEEQVWCWENTGTAPPWEALDPWSPITVNDDTTVWLFAALDYDRIKGEAKVTLLERV